VVPHPDLASIRFTNLLKPGHFRSPEFQVNFRDTFTVLLQTDRTIPRHEQEILLGVDNPSGIRLTWTATDEFGNVQQGGTGELRGGDFSREQLIY
jgi:hypothetical protein